MELVTMAHYRSRFQPTMQHIAPRQTSQRVASLSVWTGTRVSEEQALIDAIDRIAADARKPRLAVAGEAREARGGTYWRRREHDELNRQRRQGCARCKGTGEIATVGMFGEYEQPEPCPKCQRANPYTYEDPNATAF